MLRTAGGIGVIPRSVHARSARRNRMRLFFGKYRERSASAYTNIFDPNAAK